MQSHKRSNGRWSALLFVLIPCLACAAEPPSVDPKAPWEELLGRLPQEDVRERFVEATRLLLGTPYHNGPLGEGDGPDSDPRFDFSRADCVTYLEQTAALALVPKGSDYLATLDAIRYRAGEVGFRERNHYMVRDWMPANSWLFEDVTARVGQGHVRDVVRKIDRVKFLRDQGVEPRPGIDDVRELTVAYIPVEAAPEVGPRLESGDLVFWVGKREAIFVMHTGLVVRSGEDDLRFRHASSKAGHALDESFDEYAGGAGWALGFLVLRLRDDASLPSAG